MLMIRWTVAVLVFSMGMVRAADHYDQPAQPVVLGQVMVDEVYVDQAFANVMAGVFTVWDDIKDALLEQKNSTELRALRRFSRECVKAREEKNLPSMLVVLDGLKDLYQRLTTLPVAVQSSLIEVIEEMECLAMPEDCVWQQELCKITNDMHEFVDALALTVPLCMTVELQKLTKKIADLLEIGTLEIFAECVVALKKLPTLLKNRSMQREMKKTVSQLLGRLLQVPVVLNPHEAVHCVCGACE